MLRLDLWAQLSWTAFPRLREPSSGPVPGGLVVRCLTHFKKRGTSFQPGLSLNFLGQYIPPPRWLSKRKATGTRASRYSSKSKFWAKTFLLTFAGRFGHFGRLNRCRGLGRWCGRGLFHHDVARRLWLNDRSHLRHHTTPTTIAGRLRLHHPHVAMAMSVTTWRATHAHRPTTANSAATPTRVGRFRGH